MTSLADGLLKKKAPSTQIKTWIIFIPVKTVTLRNICVTEVLKKKKNMKQGVTFILLYIEAALTHSVTRHDFM